MCNTPTHRWTHNVFWNIAETDLGVLAVNYYQKELHLGYCSSPRSASVYN